MTPPSLSHLIHKLTLLYFMVLLFLALSTPLSAAIASRKAWIKSDRTYQQIKFSQG